jgi:ribosomal-protein-alanine N-acetyltransferase
MLTVEFNPLPILSTERLVLREVRKTDAAFIFSMRSNPEVMKYVDKPLMQDISEAEEFVDRVASALEQNTGITWAVALSENEQMIGTLGFWRIDHFNHRAEVGYTLQPEFQGQGLMQEAFRKMLDYGFETCQFHSVEGNVNPANDQSIRLLEKNGFVREALFRENYYFDGKFLDSAIYSLLRADYVIGS